MLYLIFHIGGRRYGLDASRIVEVVPLVDLIPQSRATDFIAGMIRYRGKQIVVVDMVRLLTGEPYGNRFSTRIVIVNYPVPDGNVTQLGLIVERATDMLRKMPGLRSEQASPIEERGRQTNENGLLPLDIEELLPPSAIREILR